MDGSQDYVTPQQPTTREDRIMFKPSEMESPHTNGGGSGGGTSGGTKTDKDVPRPKDSDSKDSDSQGS